MYFNSDDEKYHTILKLSLIALYLLAGFDLILIAIGYTLAQSQVVAQSDSTLIRNIILTVAIAEFFAIYFIKRILLQKLGRSLPAAEPTASRSQYSELLKITIVITAMCAAISIYGLVLILLGGTIELLLLFVALSLVAYQFFRLRARDFENDAE